MALWEYKVITSGTHGFATPALLETHLNTLGKDEWEIIYFQTQPANPLAFTGLARRSTQRDWVPPEIAAAASPASRPVSLFDSAAPASTAQQGTKPAAAARSEAPGETDHDEHAALPAAAAAQNDKASLRTFRDTERDLDPDAEDEQDEWDNLDEADDDLPTFFDAIKPHLRRNQRGPGMSVGIDFLAKRWDQREADIVGALKECGFTIPETEESDPEYFEFEDDLYWVNRNNRNQLFINTREKPRPVFRTAQVTPLSPDDPAAAELLAERALEKAEIEKRQLAQAERLAAAEAARLARIEESEKRRLATETARAERAAQQAAHAEQHAGDATEPAHAHDDAQDHATADSHGEHSGPDADDDRASHTTALSGDQLLDKIRPLMRRNRRGPGYSGSITFLARALRTSDPALITSLAELGLHVPATANEKPVFVEIEDALYWVNKDNRGGIWINGRENKNGASKQTSATAEATPATPTDTEAPAPVGNTSGILGDMGSDTPESAPIDPYQHAAATVAPQSPAPVAAPSDNDAHALAAVRLLLKPNKRGSGVSGEVGNLARALDKTEPDFLASLTQAGLVIPTDAEAKPTFVEHAGEIYWFSLFAKDGSLWLNAKASRSSAKKAGSTRAPRTRKSAAGKAAPKDDDTEA